MSAALALVLALAVPAAPAPALALAPCTLEGEPARCGTWFVPENRGRKDGRTIPLFVAVLPATGTPVEPDPLYGLAGGPGQGASSLAGFLSRPLAELRRHRDFVFVDLAGTGGSEALACTMYPTAQALAGDFLPIDAVRRCRDRLMKRTDLRRYTTAQLVDDLDEVRAALGHERINLYGTSYGSRAALEYLRRHGSHARSVVLKAVAPGTMQGVMHYARDTERTLAMLFAACAAEPACAKAYPEPAQELRAVLDRAERGELVGKVPDSANDSATELPLSRGAVVTTLFGLLQNSSAAVRLPLLVHQAHAGDTKSLVDTLVAYRRGLDSGLAIGMYLSVMCSEDAPRMDPAKAARDDADTALRDYRVAQLAAACREWPSAKLPPGEPRPVQSDVPVLLVSGTLDPNTNERWGEEAARTLSRATHVVIPNLSHGFSSIRECGAGFVTAFVEQGSAEGIDFSCKDRVRLPAFPLPAGSSD